MRGPATRARGADYIGARPMRLMGATRQQRTVLRVQQTPRQARIFRGATRNPYAWQWGWAAARTRGARRTEDNRLERRSDDDPADFAARAALGDCLLLGHRGRDALREPLPHSNPGAKRAGL